MSAQASVTAIIAAACLLAPLAASPAAAQAPDSIRLAASLDSVVGALRAGGSIPGLTILIARGPRAIVMRGYGYASLDHDVPAGPQTVYAIGSITKQFVAAAVLRLAEQGRLRLDDTLAAYVPAFATHGSRVTLRQLLRHTSGIPGGASLTGRQPMRLDHSRDELMQSYASAYADRQPAFPPGTAWAYQSMNYQLLGLVVEKVSGQSLWDFMGDQFFGPLGMTATGLCDPTLVVKHRATGYTSDPAGGVRAAPFMSPTIALGGHGLCSSAPDLLAWQRALVGHRALGADSYARMTQPEALTDGTRPDYGYGTVVWPFDGGSMLFHTGAVPGFTSFLAYLSARDITVVVLINGNADILAIGPAVARIAAGLPQPPELATDSQERARYVGRYAAGAVTVNVRADGDQLVADGQGTNSFRFLFAPRLLKQREGEFAMNWEPEARLTFAPGGERAEEAVLRYGGRTVRLRRVE